MGPLQRMTPEQKRQLAEEKAIAAANGTGPDLGRVDDVWPGFQGQGSLMGNAFAGMQPWQSRPRPREGQMGAQDMAITNRRRPDPNLQGIQAGQMGQMGQSQDMAITNRRPPNPNLQGINALQGSPMQQNLRYPMQNQGAAPLNNVQNQGNSNVQATTSQGATTAKGGIDFGSNMTDFSDLSPGEQMQGQIIGIGKTLQDYLFPTHEEDIIDPETGEVTGTKTVSDYEAFVPSDSYVPTLDDAPGFTQALEAAQGGLGQYQDYFSGGADAMNSATAQAQMAQDQANARGDAATGQARMGQDRANMRSNAATQAAAHTRGLANTYSLARGNMAQDFANRAVNKTGVTQDLANRIAQQTRGEVGGARNLGNTYAQQARRQGNLQSNIARQAIGGDLSREEALTAQSVANAQNTQNIMRQLSGPGAGAAYMDPYQNAVIQDTLRRLNEQGMQAQNQASAKAVQSGAFGGSREGVMQAQLGQRLQDTKADYLNKAMSQNFLQAQNAAQGAATLAGQGGQLAQGAYTTGSGRAIQGGQLALGAGELGARTALQGGELAARTALQGGELGFKAGQLGADTALRGGQLGIQAGQLGADTALKGGELLSRTALQGGQLLANTQADAARTALAGGELGARTQADAARIALAGGELGSNTALKLGQGLGSLGAAASETDQRELMNLAKLGLAPLDVLQAGATATQGNELAEEYSGIRDFSILGDYFRGVPSSQSVGMSQGSAGVANPWAAGIGGGVAGLQAGRVLAG